MTTLALPFVLIQAMVLMKIFIFDMKRERFFYEQNFLRLVARPARYDAACSHPMRISVSDYSVTSRSTISDRSSELPCTNLAAVE